MLKKILLTFLLVSFANFSSDTTLSVTGILLGDANDSYTGIIA